MRKWTALLIGLTLLLAASLGAGLAWAGDRTDTPDGGYEEPPGNPPPVQSDDDIDPGECNLVHNINACLGGAAPTDIPMSDYMGVLTQALFDLQRRLSLEHIGSLRMDELERMTWPNSCLGVALPPNVVCAQVIVPGFRIVLEAGGALHTYHTSGDRVVYVGLRDVHGTSGTAPPPPTPVLPPPEDGIAVCEPYPLPGTNEPSEPLPCDPGLIDGCTVSYPTPDLDATDGLQGEAPPVDAHQGVAITPDGDVAVGGAGGLVVRPAPPPDAERPPDVEPCAAPAVSLQSPALEPASP